MRACAHCGGPIEGRRPDARFCSDSCRKRANENQIVAECPDCGCGMTRNSRQHGVRRCRACEMAGRRRRWESRALIIADLWEDGATVADIAEAFDWQYTRVGVEIARIREWRPDLLPHRRSPEVVANIRAGWARARKAA